jgi:hypothetical protein
MEASSGVAASSDRGWSFSSQVLFPSPITAAAFVLQRGHRLCPHPPRVPSMRWWRCCLVGGRRRPPPTGAAVEASPNRGGSGGVVCLPDDEREWPAAPLRARLVLPRPGTGA